MILIPFLQTDAKGGWFLELYIFILIIILVLKFIQFYAKEQNKKAAALAGPPPVTDDTNCLVYAGKNLKFTSAELHEMLVKHFEYYRHLEKELKKRFIQRLQVFMDTKTFIIRNREGYKEMPVLLSAAAIQITFGLPHFKLPFFNYIQIHPEEYFAENSLRVLAGHVYGNTITVAWNHFYKNYQFTDGINVGLHEMAHALYFQYLVANVKKKNDFVVQFEEVMEECQCVYDGCRETAAQMFTTNAFKDLQEFWAESLEMFFERPVQLKVQYPNLYKELCDLLQQDATNKELPLIGDRKLAWESLELSIRSYISKAVLK